MKKETKVITKKGKNELPVSPKEPKGGGTKANNISHTDTEKDYAKTMAAEIIQQSKKGKV